MKFCIFDIETDGLLHEVTKLHVLYYCIFSFEKGIEDEGYLIDPLEIDEFFNKDLVFIGHNIIKYDLPVLTKLFGFTFENILLYDSLGVSYYLYPNNEKHGLETWGKFYGIYKKEIEDWSNLSLEQYIERCEYDVKINLKLFIEQWKYLNEIYEDPFPIIKYLNFKLECLKDQEYIGVPLNEELNSLNLEKLEKIFDEKTVLLSQQMPKELGKLIKEKPKKFYKKDYTISTLGIKYVRELIDRSLPLDTKEIRELPNPGSSTQLKDWLFSLGWTPITFKLSDATGEQVPQVSLPFGQGLCPSVVELFEKHPVLEELDTYHKIKHRIGILKGYQKVVRNGKVIASAQGFTKTLRLKHSKPIVNLPKPSVLYGKEVREVLTVPNDDYTMCGCDISSLEDSTKQHYIYYYDPDYVKDMRTEGFDPHIDIGLLAGLITQEEADLYKFVESLSEQEKKDIEEGKAKIYKIVKKKRGTSKQVNFACVYGAGPPKIAETAKITLVEAELLHTIYWKRNWAVKEIAKHTITKKVRNQTWLYNPLSGFWLFLENDKDKFSSLNQNTGVFVFDLFVAYARKKLLLYDIYICLQYHDEILLYCLKEQKEIVNKIFKESIKEVNDKLKLNVEINISIEWGQNYAECH
jgi:hypothetical protein